MSLNILKLFFLLSLLIFSSDFAVAKSNLTNSNNSLPLRKNKFIGNSVLLDLRSMMNASFFDDGIAHNGKGSWTDEGLNDFHTFPKPQYGVNKYYGYLFNFIDPDKNNAKNMIMTGTDKYWSELPRTFCIKDFSTKGKYIFIAHTEGQINGKKGELGGVITIKYKDGSSFNTNLIIGDELSNWWQAPWWDNFERIHQNAPENLKKSGANPNKFIANGGTREEWVKLMLKHSDAIRYPVTRGVNSISKNYSLNVVIWGLRIINPNPEKEIIGINLKSTGKCIIAILGITITDTDFSLARKEKENEMQKPNPSSLGFNDYIQSIQRNNRLKDLINQQWTKGIRDVQIRSKNIVTVRIDQAVDVYKLKNKSCYIIESKDDKDFYLGLHPFKISRFSRASIMRKLPGEKSLFVYMHHWMHLKMSKKFKKGKHYTIKLVNHILPDSPKIKTKINFSFDNTANPSYKLNQVGYSALAKRKYIYLSSYLGDGTPVDLTHLKNFQINNAINNQKVFAGKIELISEKDSKGFDKLYLIDISKFKQSGEFYIWTDELGRSYNFLNGDAAAKKIYDVIARGMYFQRSGIGMKQPYAGKWARPETHNKIYVTKKDSGHPWGVKSENLKINDPKSKWYAPGSPFEFHGGHYDAGDFDLRPMHIVIPEYFLSLYEACPKKFYDGQTLIPENKNGIPDILDEVAWNLLSLEYIQDYATKICKLDGGVAPGLEARMHPAYDEAMGKGTPLKFFMRKVTPYFSFSASAVFAQASRVFRKFDKKISDKYLKRAENAYKYAVDHKNEQCKMPRHPQTQGELWDKELLSSAWCWAAGQLFSTTGNKKYWTEFAKRSNIQKEWVAGAVGKWAILWGGITSKHKVPDHKLIEKLKNKLLTTAEQEINTINNNGKKGYWVSVPKSSGWGNGSCAVLNSRAIMRAYLLTKEQKYLDAIAVGIDWTLGMNPTEESWLTGAGKVYPMDPLSGNSYSDNIEEPIPGILPYGPTGYWDNGRVLLYPKKSKMGFYRRYVDSFMIPTHTEYTVWYGQAPFMYSVAILLPNKQK